MVERAVDVPEHEEFGAIEYEFRDAGLNVANEVRQASLASRKKGVRRLQRRMLGMRARGTLAFSAQYDGNTDVYTIPVEGGAPTRLTLEWLVSACR